MSSLTEKLKATGKVHIKLFDENGKIKDERKINNLVVTTGLEHIVARLIGGLSVPDPMSHMAIGVSDEAPVLGDDVLGGQTAIQELTSVTQSGTRVTYVADFGAGVGPGTIKEAGIFNAETEGTMLCRTTFLVVTKGPLDSLSISWEITLS